MRKAGKPPKQAEGRGEAPPGPSPAWLALKAKQKAPKRAGTASRRETIPGECRCSDRALETGEKVNPWVYGHAHWCPMFMPECKDCGMSSGTHKPDCSFWAIHPRITPF